MDYVNYAMKLTKELLETPSPGGYTILLRKKCQQLFEDLGLEVKQTNKGAIYAILPGKKNQNKRVVAAHIDTLGAMIKEIKSNGRPRVSNIGGFSWIAVEGENVTIHTRKSGEISGTLLYDKPSVHIYGDEARTGERTENTMEIRIDKDTSSKEETLDMGIRVGDFVSFDPRTVITDDGYIKSRYLDDIACVAILFAAVKKILEEKEKTSYTTYLFLTDFEEVGHGLYGIPEDATEMLALDIGTVGGNHESDEKKVTILAKDARTVYDYEFRNRLEDLALENNINYVIDVHNRYGSDVSTAVMQGFDLNFACIGLGVDATHHFERAHYEGYKNNVELLVAYLKSE